MTETELAIGVGVVAALVVLIALVANFARRRPRGKELRQRFGPEYDRAVQEYGSEKRAERELADRAKRVQKLHIRELPEPERLQFLSSWQQVQALFVDQPSAAVSDADELIKVVMRARGYPVEDFDQRVADLSVDHASVVQHYRAARILATANHEGRANTEELRQAIVHYRALFAALLGEVRSNPVDLKRAV